MVPEINDGELAGNAVLAALALDGTPECKQAALDEAINRMIRFRDIYEPLGDTAAFWEHRYELFRSGTLCNNE